MVHKLFRRKTRWRYHKRVGFPYWYTWCGPPISSRVEGRHRRQNGSCQTHIGLHLTILWFLSLIKQTRRISIFNLNLIHRASLTTKLSTLLWHSPIWKQVWFWSYQKISKNQKETYRTYYGAHFNSRSGGLISIL